MFRYTTPLVVTVLLGCQWLCKPLPVCKNMWLQAVRCRFTPSGGLRTYSFLYYICYVIKSWFIIPLALLACSSPRDQAHTPLVDSSQAVLNTFVLSDTAQLIHPDSLMQPYHYQVIKEVRGNLYGNSRPEKVVVYNTGIQTDFGEKRVLKVYSKTANGWEEIGSCNQCILSSKSGKASQDPFQNIFIQKGAIVIEHQGGMAQKWSYSHSYKWQQTDWKLTGINTNLFETCGPSQGLGYNLLQGSATYTEGSIECDQAGEPIKLKTNNTQKFKISQGDTLTFNNISVGDNKLIVPKLNKEFSF